MPPQPRYDYNDSTTIPTTKYKICRKHLVKVFIVKAKSLVK